MHQKVVIMITTMIMHSRASLYFSSVIASQSEFYALNTKNSFTNSCVCIIEIFSLFILDAD